MKTSRSIFYVMVLMLVFLLACTGCESRENDSWSMAVRAYQEGDYETAEGYFRELMDVREPDDNVRLGHAYNLIALNQIDEAINELVSLADSFDSSTAIEIRKTLKDLYYRQNNFAGMARVCSELVYMTKDPILQDEYILEGARIRADICRSENSKAALEDELRKIIPLQAYSGDEYFELYEIYISMNLKEERLALADEIIGYMRGHSAYITDYTSVIGVAFDAAKVAAYTAWEYSEEHYFDVAEEFASAAEQNNLTTDDIIKYKVILAERKGKLELAAKLLGVYLNHCPEDEKAQKELAFLENRLGIKVP